MFKDNVLTINHNTWRQGMAESAYVGVADIRNMDMYSVPGALMCGLKAVKSSESIVTDYIKQMVFDESGNIAYALDEDGNVYRYIVDSWSLLSANQVGNHAGGAIVWKNHLFVADDGHIDVYDIDVGIWQHNWQAFAEGSRGVIDLPHFMWVGQDDVVYITDGRYIASITENVGTTFNSFDGGTYTFNDEALDLPSEYVTSTLTEFGSSLIIGTYYTAALNRGNRADTFVWTPTSDVGTFTYDDTIFLKGNGVWASLAQGNVIYQLIGDEIARLYATNLSNYKLLHEFKNIPASGSTLDLSPGAIELVNDQLLFGLGSSTASVSNLGVYGYKNGTVQLAHVLSAGDTDIEVGAILAAGNGNYLISWAQDGTYGVDVVSDIRMDGYGASMETMLYRVGTPLNTRQFENIDILLGKELATGEGIRVSSRENLSDSYTVIGTFDYATYGAVSKINAPANMTDLTKVQLKVELTTPESATTSPEFVELNIY